MQRRRHVLLASAAQAPPAAWFRDPLLGEPTPLTVTADGRVFGHAAAWNTCHTGVTGRCTTPPRSPSSYRYFHLKLRETAEGETVPVGTITIDTGHAPLTASREATVRHYDHTGARIADVAVGEDVHGIWVAGALKPGADPNQVQALKAAALSGDWRSVNGALELIGLLAVNVPGFPVPRSQAALAAAADAGELVTAVVAAGVVCGCEETPDHWVVVEEFAREAAMTEREVSGALESLAAAAFDESKVSRYRALGKPGDPYPG